MQTLKSENVVMYDVDDTLVMWDTALVDDVASGLVAIKCPYSGSGTYSTESWYYLKPHEPHITLLKNHHARGKTVIVWSQGGYAWAEAVVKALGLEEYVDLVMSKPRAYIDDLPVQEWLKDRIYIKHDSPWGQGRNDNE